MMTSPVATAFITPPRDDSGDLRGLALIEHRESLKWEAEKEKLLGERDAIYRKYRAFEKILKSGFDRDRKRKGLLFAHKKLVDIDKSGALKVSGTPLNVYCFGEEVKGYAAAAARKLNVDLFDIKRRLGLEAALGMVDERLKDWEIDKRLSDCKSDDDRLSLLARVVSDRWLKSQIKKNGQRKGEKFLREYGQVRAGVGGYVSEHGLQAWRVQNKRNARLFEGLELYAELESGEEITCAMSDAIAASPANPANKEAELFVRARGVENCSVALGRVMLFVTVTCPSSYHAYNKLGSGSVANSKFSGASPRQGQEYLCGVWSRVRAELQRRKIKIFGFRVAEPHHDGTPHWHLLVSVAPSDEAGLREVFNRYALEMDFEEVEGSPDVRVRFDKINKSAVGYLAKYISKNVGHGARHLDAEGGDFETGEDGVSSAERVQAWASIWGIRQFQQIGSISVTVWREIRRLKKEELPEFDGGLFEEICEAVELQDWALFCEKMGGVLARRDEQALRPVYAENEGGGCYGDSVKRLVGLFRSYVPASGSFVLTRFVKWGVRLVEKKELRGVEGVRVSAPPWPCVNNCTGVT